ncbi:hypothetical protein M433DRAFT_146367 [Acidomyces richmondensis BFW]|nr:MAG: hypothetical protein FE78DRAFT_74094 [Acidomyces sp. 'richmondensis']KYG42891.1 hypothetical protein M433DRAFT_146367 [Acidomyces richmondensis BFW]
MESPPKRLKYSPSPDADYLPLDANRDDLEAKFGYNQNSHDASRKRAYLHNPTFLRRHAQDRPESAHPLPGHSPWLLVRTRFGRRFVHNPVTNVSLWRVPRPLWGAVTEWEAAEEERKEKEENARWAEEELGRMRVAGEMEAKGEEAERKRRRRSESLQREDEEAMMAELQAEGEPGGEVVVRTYEPVAGDVGYDSEGSYEYVEVTDSEGEEADEGPANAREDAHEVDQKDILPGGEDKIGEELEPGPVEFGEDDIAYQLASMEAEAEAYDMDEEGESPENDAADQEYAVAHFHTLLDTHHISPFTPWDRLITNHALLTDPRWTLLPTTKARRVAFDVWVRERAAALRAQPRKAEHPRIAFLAFLSQNVPRKKGGAVLYWAEFRRKYAREAVMKERRWSEKEREGVYREYVRRLKLSEGDRRRDLRALLERGPDGEDWGNGMVPERVRGLVEYMCLPEAVRDEVVREFVESLPEERRGCGVEGVKEEGGSNMRQ